MHSTDNLVPEPERLRVFQLLRILGTFWPCAVVLWVVPGKLFVSPDSTQYLSAARNLLAGNGLAAYWWSGRPEPLTHFPPLYPFILSLLARVGFDLEQAALWLNIVALATIVWQSSGLAGLLAGGHAVQRARVMAVCALAVGLAHDVIYVSVMLFTEPLFIALSLCALSALGRWLASTTEDAARADGRTIAWSGVCCGLALLTRFVGPALIATCVLAIVMNNRKHILERLRPAAFFTLIAGAPLSAWLAYNQLRDLKVSNRDLVWHTVSLGELKFGMLTVSHWLSPFIPWAPARFLLLALGGLCLAGLTVSLWHVGLRDLFRPVSVNDLLTSRTSDERGPSRSMAVVAMLFVVAYAGLLITSISVVDKSTPLDLRILSPLLPIAILLAVALVALLARSRSDSPGWPSRVARISGATLGGVYLVSQGFALVVWAPPARSDGLGLNATADAAPAVLAKAGALPREAVIYSNMPDLIYYFTGRVVYGLPWRHSPTSLLPNPNYATELSNLSHRLAPTYVVIFDRGADRTYVATVEEVGRQQHFATLDSMPGGYVGRVTPLTSSQMPSRTTSRRSMQ